MESSKHKNKNIKYCISASVELNSFANGFPFRFTSQTIALLFEWKCASTQNATMDKIAFF